MSDVTYDIIKTQLQNIDNLLTCCICYQRPEAYCINCSCQCKYILCIPCSKAILSSNNKCPICSKHADFEVVATKTTDMLHNIVETNNTTLQFIDDNNFSQSQSVKDLIQELYQDKDKESQDLVKKSLKRAGEIEVEYQNKKQRVESLESELNTRDNLLHEQENKISDLLTSLEKEATKVNQILEKEDNLNQQIDKLEEFRLSLIDQESDLISREKLLSSSFKSLDDEERKLRQREQDLEDLYKVAEMENKIVTKPNNDNNNNNDNDIYDKTYKYFEEDYQKIYQEDSKENREKKEDTTNQTLTNHVMII